MYIVLRSKHLSKMTVIINKGDYIFLEEKMPFSHKQTSNMNTFRSCCVSLRQLLTIRHRVSK